jgi:hypothetical protein
MSEWHLHKVVTRTHATDVDGLDEALLNRVVEHGGASKEGQEAPTFVSSEGMAGAWGDVVGWRVKRWREREGSASHAGSPACPSLPLRARCSLESQSTPAP